MVEPVNNARNNNVPEGYTKIKMYDEKIRQILKSYKIKGFVLSNVSDYFHLKTDLGR